ncbi:MAG TPA: 6-bladed beta-propeller, partial [Gemmatimonadaceae bacterium]|nr:6-bladed beta-propeller [Gemmatimonadaceae bacterium]
MPRHSALFASLLVVASLQAVPRLRGTVDLTIGGEDAPDEATFGRVTGLALGPDGRIYVADNQDNTVRVFSADGKFLFKFGGKGSGPGEFTYLGAVTFGPDGLFWTRDEGNFRYQSFAVGASKAEFRTTRRMLQHGRGIHDPIVFDAAGNVIEIGRVNAPNANQYQRILTSIDAQGNAGVADTTGAPPEDSVGVRYIRMPPNPSCRDGCVVGRFLYQPFAPLPLIAFAPNGEFAEAISSRYAISWTAFRGKQLHLLQQAATGVEPTAEEQATEIKRFDELLAELKMSRATAPFGVPRTKPPLRDLKFSTNGELWV